MLLPLSDSIRLADLPRLLGPYARTAPVYVYLQGCGTLTATRFRREENTGRVKEEAELMLVLGPKGTLSQTGA